MKKCITHVLIIFVFLMVSFLNKSYGQPEIKLIASRGTFSVSPKQGHIPIIFSSFHILTVDSNSYVVLNMPSEDLTSKIYAIIGPGGTFRMSNLSTNEIVNTNETLIWETEIEKLVNWEKKIILIKWTSSNEKLKNNLEKIGFDYLPNYPDIISLDFNWSELTHNEENDKEFSPLVGETDFNNFSDTVSVPTPIPENVINQEFSFLAGKWKMFINGREAVLNLDSLNFELSGYIIFKNREIHELQGLSFFEPLISFNLQKKINMRQISIPFVARIDMSKPNKMFGIFEDEDTIHTWSAIMSR